LNRSNDRQTLFNVGYKDYEEKTA